MDINIKNRTVIIEIALSKIAIKRVVEEKGYPVVEHNFGVYRKIDHTRTEWEDDIDLGVKIGKLWYRLENAFQILFRESTITQIKFKALKSNLKHSYETSNSISRKAE